MKKIYTPTKQKKILLVDDDAAVANVYQNILRSERFKVELADSGEAALQCLAKEPVDLVILDFSVPGMDGTKILRTIRSQVSAELPVVVFANFYLPEVVQAASEAGATRCIRKSDYTPHRLVEVARELLAASQPITAVPRSGAVSSGFESEYKARLISDFLAGGRQQLGRMRLSYNALMNSSSEEIRLAELVEMRHSSRSLAGIAGIAGFREIAELADALGSLFIQLAGKPAKLTPSINRTIGQAIDLLGATFDHVPEPDADASVLPAILVVDDEIISREAICSAIERAGMRAVSVDDSMAAQGILEKTHFDLIFLDVEMPGQTGLELCSHIRKMATNRATPVVFVTAHSDFQSRAQSVLSGGNDFIAKPFLPIELAVKTLIWTLKNKAQPLPSPDLNSSADQVDPQQATEVTPDLSLAGFVSNS
jgi:CheY-like chemotaxis protein